MKYEVFENIINRIIDSNDTAHSFYKMGLDINNITDEYSSIISKLLSAYYSKEGLNWIDWYLYERESISGDILTAQDKDGNEICYDIKSLWLCVENIRCSDNFEEYVLPVPMTDEERINVFEQLFKK